MSLKNVTQTTTINAERNNGFAKASSPGPSSLHPLLQLHQTIGNRAVGRMIQAKLKVNQPGDRFEQEADRVADQVMRMPEPLVQQQEDEEERIQAKPLAAQLSPLIQRQSISIQRKCAACSSGKETCAKCAEEERLQRKPNVPTRWPSIQRQEDDRDDELLQGKSTSSYAPTVIPRVSANINAMRGGGQPLSPSVRGFFEPRFGADLSGVRVHRDSRAAETAREVHAKAFTVGRDVMFGSGHYAPETSAGKKLLAHELTHVVQQRAAMQRPPAFVHRRTKAFASERLNAPIMMRAPSDEPRGGKRRFAISLAKTPEPKVVRTKWGVQLTVYFGQNISSLNYESFKEVEKFVKELRDSDNEMVFVDGFASTEGTDEHNLELSRRRRDEVIAILSSKLSKKIQFSGKAHGEKGAAVEESGGPGSDELENLRAQNRRVQIRISRRESEKAKRDFANLVPSDELLEKFATPRRRIPCGSASPTSLFDSQPEALKAVIEASVAQAFCRKERDAAACFNFMDSRIKSALIRIYSRLCEFGLWHHVHSIEKFAAGEKPVDLGLWKLESPGLSENLHFFSYDSSALYSALSMHPKFCEDRGIGGALHPGQRSIRQVNPGGKSLHFALDKPAGPGKRFDAHIDRYAPVEKRLKGGACPEEFSIGTQLHWFRELVPEKVRSSPVFRALMAALIYSFDYAVGGPLHSRVGLKDWLIASLALPVPGFQIYPEQPTRSVQDRLRLPSLSERDLPPPIMFGITLFHDLFGGDTSSEKSRQRLLPKEPEERRTPAPKDDETFDKASSFIDELVKKNVTPHALVPAGELWRLRLAERRLDYALPEEEELAQAGLRDARRRIEDYANPVLVARELTRRMYDAHKNGRPVVEFELGPQYQGIKGKKAIASAIERIALIIRGRLPDHAAPVHSIWVYFGNKFDKSGRRADEKVEIDLKPLQAQTPEKEASAELKASEILELLRRSPFLLGP